MLTRIKSWYHEDKKDILWTVVGAVLSTILGLLCQDWFHINPVLPMSRMRPLLTLSRMGKD